ncbi:MAG: hypothetical protein ACOC12_08885 [Bacteroidota bacterium]
MKSKLLLVWVFVMAAVAVIAQESTFNKEDKVLNLGIGIGSTLYSGAYYNTKIPPLSASLEFGIIDNLFEVENLNLGVGGYVGFSMSEWRYTWWGEDYGWRYTNIILGARGTIHYPIAEKLDTYTGLLLGPNIVLSSEFGDWGDGDDIHTASGSGLVYAYYIGARYYLKENLGVMAELGYGISYINLGVALKL